MDPSIMRLLPQCACEGTEDQWNELCRHLRPLLRSFVAVRLRQYGEKGSSISFLDDLVQDVFCRLLAKDRTALRTLARLEKQAVISYLVYVCRTVVVDRFRRRTAVLRGGTDEDADLESVNYLAIPAGEASDPERMFLVREARRTLRSALQEVSSRTQQGRLDCEIFELATVYQWSSREIASVTSGGLSPTAIDVRVTRTRKKLERRFFPEIQVLRREGSGRKSSSEG